MLTCRKFSIFVGTSPLTFMIAKSDIPKTSVAISLSCVLSSLYCGASNPSVSIIKSAS